MNREKRFFSVENSTLIILSCAGGFAFFDRLSIRFLFPYMQADLGLTQSQLGTLASALAVMVALSGIFLSKYAEVLGKKKLLLIIVFGLGICSALQMFASSFLTLLLLRMLMGVIEGLFVPVCQSIMADFSNPKRIGLNMGIVQGTSVALIASTLGPILLVWVADKWGWRAGFGVLFIPCLILALTIIKFLTDKKTQIHASGRKTHLSVGELFKNRNFLICFIITSCMLTWYLVLAIFLPSYFVSDAGRGYSDKTMSLVATGMGLGGMIWGLLGPAVSDFIGRKRAVLGLAIFSALTPIIVLFAPVSPVSLMILIAITYTGQGILTLSIATIPSESLPEESRTTAIGVIAGGGELIGGVLAPFVAGKLANTNISAPLYITLIAALIVILFSGSLKETFKK